MAPTKYRTSIENQNLKMTRVKARNENLKITQSNSKARNQNVKITRSKARMLIENLNLKRTQSKAWNQDLKSTPSTARTSENQNSIMTRSKAKTIQNQNLKMTQSKARTSENQNLNMTQSKARTIQNQNLNMIRSKARTTQNQNLKMTQFKARTTQKKNLKITRSKAKTIQNENLKIARAKARVFIQKQSLPPKNINILPKELIVHILNFLPIEDILRCESVCNLWKTLSQNYTIWKKFVIVYTHDPYHSRVNDRNLQLMKTHTQLIYCIKLQYIYDYSYLISLLKNFKNIISLEFISCQVNKDFAKRIKVWPTLRTLSFKNSPMEEECMFDFNKMPYLKYLALEYCGLSTVNFDSLLSCNLSHIFIDQILDLTKENILNLITARQEHIRSFRIYGGDSVDDNCLQLLGKCKLLSNLGIVKCGNLTDKGLTSLASLRSLRHLMLWHNNKFSERALLTTFSNPNLHKIVTLGLVKIDRMSPVIVDMISEKYKSLSSIVLSAGSGFVTDYEGQMAYKFRKNKLAFCMFFKYLF